ncbi:UNVERIFIED_CONTAM: hypothetical protein GTU68_049906 [Idotea baltica]|nr:hypothetical protein [Idotea baltica]
MRRPGFKFDIGWDTTILPPIHSAFNIVVAISLMAALYFVKKKNIIMHRRMIYNALFFSFLFLLSYVAYHFTQEETLFCKQGPIRVVYFFVLITHIVLAGLSLPLILFTFIKAYTHQYDKHRMMARWVFPIWLYVAITGPLSYFMLMPCYG